MSMNETDLQDIAAGDVRVTSTEGQELAKEVLRLRDLAYGKAPGHQPTHGAIWTIDRSAERLAYIRNGGEVGGGSMFDADDVLSLIGSHEEMRGLILAIDPDRDPSDVLAELRAVQSQLAAPSPTPSKESEG